MLRDTAEHQQSRAALAGGALAELLKGTGRGWWDHSRARCLCSGSVRGRAQGATEQQRAAEERSQDRNGAG